ncbi:MAG: nucleoside triphosphate pyrophosphohydrolase [Candidatus Humimicrobiaceae bacterium]
MKINIAELEKNNNPDELFSLLVDILAHLRSPEGCVWDREQDHNSIKKNMVEEAYEAVEAIENKDYQSLKEELGDLLLQVIFHSQIAIENNEFNLSDVIKEIIKKLYRRHPHVFGDKNFKSPQEVLISWEEIKKKERKNNPKKTESIFNDIPKILPALHYAYEIQNRASRLGFDWDETGLIFNKINEEINELTLEFKKSSSQVPIGYKNSKETLNNILQIKDELGDVLFSLVNLSRHLNLDSEECLKQTCNKFIKRFNEIEKLASSRNLDFKNLPLNDKDKLWDEVKQNEDKY